MAKLILDTCSWLDLAKPKFSEIFYELESQVNSGITVLLTSDIIINEWDRHKDKILDEIIISIRTHARSAMKIAELLDKKDKIILQTIIEKYRTIEVAQEQLANIHYNKIESLLKNSTLYNISDDLKVKMANRALSKKAPFHNNKNNMADALLYFGAIEHIEKENLLATDLFFVTINYKDFCDTKDNTKLHPELTRPNIHFYNNVAHALKMRKELVDEMDELNEFCLWNSIIMQAEIEANR